MTTKKTTKPVKEDAVKEDAVEELEQLTEEESRDIELSEAELLEDMPELREPTQLRIRHKNRLAAIAYKLDAAGIAGKKIRKSDTTMMIALMEVIGEIDEFAESIAYDKVAYEEWAIANSDNQEVFLALFHRYMSAVGE